MQNMRKKFPIANPTGKKNTKKYQNDHLLSLNSFIVIHYSNSLRPYSVCKTYILNVIVKLNFNQKLSINVSSLNNILKQNTSNDRWMNTFNVPYTEYLQIQLINSRKYFQQGVSFSYNHANWFYDLKIKEQCVK